MPKKAEAAERVRSVHAYCVFCETQKCDLMAQLIQRRTGIFCLSPQIIQRKWVKGECQEKRHAWLPGYIFLYPEKPLTERFWLPGMIRWLGHGELEGHDLDFAVMLKERGGVMGTVRLVEEGDRCTVEDPLWKQMEGRVIKIDRGRKRCCVEFVFDALRRAVCRGYELVKPVTDEQP